MQIHRSCAVIVLRLVKAVHFMRTFTRKKNQIVIENIFVPWQKGYDTIHHMLITNKISPEPRNFGENLMLDVLFPQFHLSESDQMVK